MSTSRWSEQETLKLIQLYKAYNFLWDKKRELYKNIYARKKAYDTIVYEMDIPGLTSQDVRCKIKNLRTSYYQELRKMASCKANNKSLRPLKWFLAFKSIMGNASIDGTIAKPSESNTETEEEEEEEEDQSQSNLQLEDLFFEESTSNSDAYVVSIKQEFLDEMDNLGDKICDYLEPVPPKRYKPDPPRVVKSEPEEPMPSGSRSVTRSKRTKSVDEFQMFANNIAQQLRKLPLNRALNLQVEVQRMIARERIELLRKMEEKKNDEEDSS